MGVFDVDESSVCGVSREGMDITDKRLFFTQHYYFLNKWTNTTITRRVTLFYSIKKGNTIYV